MKKILRTILPFCFLFLLVSPVFALTGCPTCGTAQTQEQTQEEIQEEVREQVRTTNPNLGELKQNVIEKREAIREMIEEKRATITARLAERRKEHVRNFFGRITIRFQAAIDRLERLITRIESRLSKIEENNEEIDTETIQEDLDDVKDQLVETESALTEAKASLEVILDSEDPREAFTSVRDLIKGIKQQLIEIHQTLVHIIGDIKGLRVGQGVGQPVATPLPEASPIGE